METKNPREVFNFCTGKSVTVKDTVEKIAELAGFRGEIQWGSAPPRPTKNKMIVGSYEKAKRVLNWEPKWSLERGLAKTVEWWREEAG